MTNTFISDFAAYLRGAGKAENTIEAYTRDLRLFGRWFQQTNGESMTPQAITPIDVREYRAHLLNVREMAPATCNRKLSSLRAFCAWAQREGLIDADPTRDIGGVEEVQMAPRWLEKTEEYALVRAVQKEGDVRDEALITLMLNTGLRVGEVCRLRREDIEMSARKGHLMVRGKGTRFRTEPLNAEARKALREYLEVRSQVEHDHLFVGQRGEPLGPEGVRYMVDKYAYLGQVEGVTPHTLRHTLRHTFAKRLVEAGTPLNEVAVLLGHKSLDTTAMYTLPSQRDLQQAVDRIG